eukprot:CAMPEP_0114348570 /NCGR_PEP_ID=MMETSP0101-20121206/14815_1 /TAXON_ID=38822 ORGANISM="Pteridomonas danica, Strain PT" /NCGR_SAMPLE_ID=MMETSP0101 /ASSEMBLY_ACC=CAM_ASM_000211 /LENGTH=509 /DNA_ID=CAMNT_0001486577 /DNA_START=42 /DNA_END=1568 /DNA_ORIENTATION=+
MGSTTSTHEEEESHQNKELEKEKEHPDNKKLEGSDEFKGPSDPKNRHTTDCLCTLLILAMWFSMTVIGFIVCGVIQSDSLPAGDPRKLTHMLDYEGSICGVSNGVANKEYAYYLPSGTAVCVKKCPSKTDYSKFICQYQLQDAVDNDIFAPAYGLSQVAEYTCMFEIATVPGPGYICIYDAASDNGNATSVDDAISSAGSSAYGDPPSSSSMEDFSADIMLTWHLILIFGFLVAMIMGFVSLRLLRIPCMLNFLIWGCIGGVFALLLGLGIMLRYVTATAWEDEDPRTRSDTDIAAVKGLGTFFLVLCGVWTCIICCLRRRIMLAIGITKEAAKALGAMTALILFPVFQTLAILAFSCVWFVYIIYLASSGEVVKETYEYAGQEFESQTYQYSTSSKRAYWYLLFCWFWTSEFIMAFGQIVTAMSVAFWYFARDKSSIGSLTVLTAVKTTARYHVGTAAFGSLIIAIIKTIRAFIAHLQKNADKLAKRGGMVAANIAKAILCCLQCCMW